MKKLFTFVFALCAFSFAAKAQVTITLEAHDVWEDGSGYQLLLDADHTAYGTIIPEQGALTTSGDVPASTYAEFEYKIPENADGSLTTTNIVFDGAVTIQIPAGTYDYCITNPTPGARMWIAGGEGSRADDYVFENGKSYHFYMDQNGEGGDGVTITISGVGVEEVENTTFSVYPNPATTNITVKGEGSMEIVNTLGQVIVSEQVNGQANINVANLESGIYFVRMNGATQKFIKK